MSVRVTAGSRSAGSQLRRVSLLATTLGVLLLILPACGGGEAGGNAGSGGSSGAGGSGGSGGKEPVDPEDIRGEEVAREDVGASGAVIEADGIRVTIPPGALTNETEIRIARLKENEENALPGAHLAHGARDFSLERVGDVFALTPHGTTFQAPVTVELSDVQGAHLVMRLPATSPLEAWETTRRVADGDASISVETDRFSYYGAFRFDEEPTRCSLAVCGAGELKSCSDDDAGCWKIVPNVELSPPPALAQAVVSTYDTVSHAADLSSQFPLRYQVFRWTDVDPFTGAGEGNFALSFFPLNDSEVPTAGTTEHTEAIACTRDKVEHRGLLHFEVSAVVPFGANYMLLGAGNPFLYSPQPLLFYAYRDGTSARMKLREVRPIITDTTGLLEEFKTWTDLRMGSREDVYGVKDGNNLHVIIDLEDEVSFRRPQPTVRWTIPVNELGTSGTGPIAIRTIQSNHILRTDESGDSADLLAVAPVRDDGSSSRRNGVALLWNEFQSVEHDPEDWRNYTHFYDYSAELRDIRSGAVRGHRILKRAQYRSPETSPQTDCLLNRAVGPTEFSTLYAREAYVSLDDGSLNEVAAFSGGYGGVVSYAAASGGATPEWFTCKEPPDFDPNMQHAPVLDVKFSPGADRHFIPFSMVWGLADFDYQMARFAVAGTENTGAEPFEIRVFESPTADLSVLSATNAPSGHRIFALETAHNEQGKYFRLYRVEANANGFTESASGPRPEDWGLSPF